MQKGFQIRLQTNAVGAALTSRRRLVRHCVRNVQEGIAIVAQPVQSSVKRSKLPVISDAVWTLTEKATPSPVMSLVLAKSVENIDWLFETVITNVPGPPMPLYVMGQEVLSLIPLVPLASASKMQILVSILSYNGRLGFGITGDAERASDIDVLLDGILDELAVLADLAAAQSDN